MQNTPQILGFALPANYASMTYDDWLDFFRTIPAAKLIEHMDELEAILPMEGYAAARRWQEIIENPSKMDKLYQGRLAVQSKQSIMDLAVVDDDESFYEALIRENVQKLDESRNSAQEVARITQNLNIFRQELREIRSRKPKKGTVLEKVLELSSKPVKAPQKRSTQAKKSPVKKTTKKPAKKDTKCQNTATKPAK